MNATTENTANRPDAHPSAKGAIASFFDTLVSTVVFILLAAGLVALTLTWRSSDLAFEGANQVVVTRSTWWGFNKTITKVEASALDGWTIVEDDETRKPLRSQTMRLPN